MKKKKQMDNLTRDVLAAETAGFGPWYGRYIAAFGHTGEPVPKKAEKRSITCQLCGLVFYVSDNLHRKYCADCTEIARRRQQKASRERKQAPIEEKPACAALPG